MRRVESLSEALLPQWRSGLPHLGNLRYQLLTGIAGTLAWARELRATRAVFAIQEFVTDQTRDDKHAQNASDLNQFLERLTDGAIRNLAEGALVGPLRVPETRGYLRAVVYWQSCAPHAYCKTIRTPYVLNHIVAICDGSLTEKAKFARRIH